MLVSGAGDQQHETAVFRAQDATSRHGAVKLAMLDQSWLIKLVFWVSSWLVVVNGSSRTFFSQGGQGLCGETVSTKSQTLTRDAKAK